MLAKVALIFVILARCGNAKKSPLIIGHRGSAGMYPEHTALSYREAIKQGADYIECDVEVTKDYKLVCSHEPWISDVVDTSLYPQFKLRNKTYTINDEDPKHDWNDKGTRKNWFIWDFTLAELKSMKRIQPVSYRDKQYDGIETFCTFEEYIDIAKKGGAGIYPEIKHGHFTDQLLSDRNPSLPKEGTMVKLILEVLEKKGYTSADSKCFLQSFEKKGIEQLKGKTKLKRNFLMDDNNKEYKALWKKDVLEWAKKWEVTGFGFSKTFIVVPYGLFPRNPNLSPQQKGHINVAEKFGETMIEDAHAAGMDVHVFTFRNEDRKLLFEYGQDPYNEYQKFLDLGIDGFFTDFPATANRILNGVLSGGHVNNEEELSSSAIVGIILCIIAIIVIIVAIYVVRRSKEHALKSIDGLELPATASLKV